MKRSEAERLEQWCVRTASYCWHGFREQPLAPPYNIDRAIGLRHAACIVMGGSYDRLVSEGPEDYEEAGLIQMSEARHDVWLAWEAINVLPARSAERWLDMIYGKETR